MNNSIEKLWTIESESLPTEPEAILRHGTLFQLANGMMGYRGTLDEYRSEQCVGITLAGFFDQVGKSWREPVNAPNGGYTSILVNGKPVHALETQVLSHRQCIHMRNAVFERQTTYDIEGIQATIHSRRFLSLVQPNLMGFEYEVSADRDCDIELMTGIDSRIWDLNGPHLEAFEYQSQENTLVLRAKTHEQHKTLVVAETLQHSFDNEIPLRQPGVYGRQFKFRLIADEPIYFQKFVSVFKSGDVDEAELVPTAVLLANEARKLGFKTCLEMHSAAWERRWAATDVEIVGDDEAQLALRFSLFQLLMVAPPSGSANSIPARALSGQVYKGAIFWDTEFFMFPFFLHTLSDVAETLLRYRIRTLNGARRKATSEGTGYRGAFYAWESQDTGDEACTYFNVGDPFTKRDLRTYFRDKQIHISGDVALAFWDHFIHTGDDRLLREGGAEVVFECARFYLSWLYYKSVLDRFEVLDVVGPDEYHERVNNNAFTNRIVHGTFDTALAVAKHFQEKDPAFLNSLLEILQFREELQQIEALLPKLYQPSPDPETGVIEQFDGYFKLEDASVEEVKSRKLLPNEYLGAGQGVAAHTQVIKQADVVMMMHRFRNDFDIPTKFANWNYYEPRTEHGSSLSACAYAMVAIECGKVEQAYPYFLKTARVDLDANYKMYAGTTFIGGSHPAANGGSWMTAIFGFAGLDASGSSEEIHLRPQLPESWQQLRFPFRNRNGRFEVTVTRNEVRIQAANGNPGPASFRVGTKLRQILPGSTEVILYHECSR